MLDRIDEALEFKVPDLIGTFLRTIVCDAYFFYTERNAYFCASVHLVLIDGVLGTLSLNCSRIRYL